MSVASLSELLAGVEHDDDCESESESEHEHEHESQCRNRPLESARLRLRTDSFILGRPLSAPLGRKRATRAQPSSSSAISRAKLLARCTSSAGNEMPPTKGWPPPP